MAVQGAGPRLLQRVRVVALLPQRNPRMLHLGLFVCRLVDAA